MNLDEDGYPIDDWQPSDDAANDDPGEGMGRTVLEGEPMRVEIFKRRKGWYWRLRAGNNRIVAIGGEPFATQRSCERSFWNTVVDMGDVTTIKVIR